MKKKSRLTRTDVNTICEMQRTIDAYESYIIAILSHSNLKRKHPLDVLERGTEMDCWVGEAIRNIDEMRERLKTVDNGTDVG